MADPPSDYVAYWAMDDNLNPTGGTPTGSPTYVTGKAGKALSLVNSGSMTQYVTLSGCPLTSGQMTAGWSIAAWLQDHEATVSHGGSSHFAVTMWIDGNNFIKFGDYPAVGINCTCWLGGVNHGADQNQNNASFPVDTWVHSAAVWNGSAFTLYRNGSVVTNVTSSHTAGTSANMIGAGDATGLSYWWGLIDEVRVYSYALTSQQVNDCMNYTGVTGTTYDGGSEVDGSGALMTSARAALTATTLVW